MSLGTLSHVLAAGVFLLLTALLAFSWKGRAQGARFILATTLTAVWAVVLAVQSHWERLPFFVVYVAELLRAGAWLAVLLGVASAVIPRTLRITIVALLAVLLLAALAQPILESRAVEIVDHTLLMSRSGLVLALCGLVLLEQVYRNSGAAARRGLRYLVIGVGGLFAYDLFLYSQAELLRGIDADAWDARGAVNALLVPMIAVAVRRNPEWSLDIFVSRHVVFYTSTLIAVGIYLLAMSLGGYYVREFGGAWGGVAQIIFLVGAGAVLASLIVSVTLRTRMRVFLNKHFYRNKYDYRIEWLRFIETLSCSSEDDVGRRALRAVAQIFSSPGGILFTVDESGRSFVPAAAWRDHRHPAALAEIRADHELVRFLASRQWIIDLEEYDRLPDVYQNIELPDWIRADRELRIISPLLALDRLVGFVVLYAPPSPFKLTFEDRDLLKTVGRHVAIQIAQHEADHRLAESRQFEAYNRLTAFMMHDLKNSVAQLQLLVANAARHKHNPAFIDDAISTIANTVERMNRLLTQLRGDDPKGGTRPVELGEVVRSAVSHCLGRKPAPTFEADTVVDRQSAVVHANPDKLLTVIENVIRNAQDATPESGWVAVRLRGEDGSAVIDIEDNGCGMDSQFVRERLFRPFDSTKGAKGMGVGAYQAREYVRLLGGEMDVRSSRGQGTTFSIRLPLMPAGGRVVAME